MATQSEARRRSPPPFLVILAGLAVAPGVSHACACGCGIFDVGAGTMTPTDAPSGIALWGRYAYMDQNRNWQGGHQAAAADNFDKKLATGFYTFGGDYMVDDRWSLMAELPVYRRSLTTTDDGSVAGPPGSLYTGRMTDLGDLQLTALYTGLSEDLTTGLSFGVKLPTGNDSGPAGPLGGREFDRDSLPGTGSTDLMLGAYHVGALDDSASLVYFVQARYQVALLTRNDYRPGDELDAAIGVSYDLGAAGRLSRIAPTFQLLESYRLHDSGANADPPNTGYERTLAAPGIELRFDRLRLYGDVELPIRQHFNSDNPATADNAGQLAASVLYKLQIGYSL